MMETIEIPNQNIQGLIKMAINEQLPWLTLASVLDELTPTITISKQIIKILLKELENLQSKLKEYQVKTGTKYEQLTPMIRIRDEINFTNDVIEIDQADELLDLETQEFVRDEEENHVDPSFQCPKCDKIFMFSIALTKHLESHETLKKLVENGETLYTFIGDYDIIDQNDTTKESDISNIVKHTNKEIKSKQSTDIRNQKSKTKIKCNTCSKEFNKKYDLKNHEMIHTGEVPFQCKTCNKRFNVKGNLTVHEKIHANKKEFHCKSCYKSFITKYKLLQHEKIHTGAKPFECKTCSKTFRLSHHLTRHNRIHTGETPYECQTCNTYFVSYFNLHRHERIHNKER